MSVPSGQYTLYYSFRSPLSSDETGHEEQFNDIVAALSRAFLVLQQGGNPTGIVYDNAWLFSRDDLKEVLKRVSDNRGQSVEVLAEAVRKALPDVSEEEIERQLAREGLIRLPPTARRTRGEFKPIDVAGKPISEMIIEERR